VSWQVSGIKRGSAYLVSQDENGRPNYGGTPSDQSILETIKISELKMTSLIILAITSFPIGGLFYIMRSLLPYQGKLTALSLALKCEA